MDTTIVLLAKVSMKGKKTSRWRPFLYRSWGGRLDVATNTQPLSNIIVQRDLRSKASAMSVTCISSSSRRRRGNQHIVSTHAMQDGTWNSSKHITSNSSARPDAIL